MSKIYYVVSQGETYQFKQHGTEKPVAVCESLSQIVKYYRLHANPTQFFEKFNVNLGYLTLDNFDSKMLNTKIKKRNSNVSYEYFIVTLIQQDN